MLLHKSGAVRPTRARLVAVEQLLDLRMARFQQRDCILGITGNPSIFSPAFDKSSLLVDVSALGSGVSFACLTIAFSKEREVRIGAVKATRKRYCSCVLRKKFRREPIRA